MLVLRRGLSTLIPPKIVSAKQLGATQNAKKVSNMVSFYKALPRAGALSPAEKAAKGGFINWYRAKYFDGKNASGVPLLHLAFGIALFGYSLEYYLHLRHHKGGEAAEEHH